MFLDAGNAFLCTGKWLGSYGCKRGFCNGFCSEVTKRVTEVEAP